MKIVCHKMRQLAPFFLGIESLSGTASGSSFRNAFKTGRFKILNAPFIFSINA